MSKKISKIVLTISFLTIIGIFFNIDIKEVNAISVVELREQIAQLQAQLVALQQQLAELTGGSGAWCYDFNINLRYGDRGNEVSALQTALELEGFSGLTSNIRGIFEEHTASAVVGFQEKYAEDILASWGLKHGTGYAGTTTRNKLNELYGCKDQASITVLSPNGGEKWTRESTYYITWIGAGIDRINIDLAAGDTEKETIATNISASLGKYSWAIPSSVASGDNYRIIIRQPALSYAILDQSDNYFSIISTSGTAAPTCILTANPSSGLAPLSGTLTWVTANNPTSCTAFGSWSESKNTAGGTENYGPLNVGIYTYALICSNSAGSGNCSARVDMSSGSLSIPACSFLASPSSGTAPLSGKLTWNVSGNPTSCTASGDWSGSKNTAGGTENYGPLNVGTYIYTLTCSNSAGTGTCSKTITAFSNPPTCVLITNPISGNAPLSGTLSWATTNKPTSCIASGSWSGSKNIAGGTENYGPLSAGTYTYTLACSNSAGTNTCSITLNVSAVSLDIEYIRPTAINSCFGSGIWGTEPGDKCGSRVAKAVDDQIGFPDYFISYIYDIQASDYYEENSCHVDLENIDSDASIAKITVHVIARATNNVDGAELGAQLGINCNRYNYCTDEHCTVISPSSWKPITTSWTELAWDWDVNPATLAPWTKNDINNLSVGIMRHKMRYGMVNVTQLYVAVHYAGSPTSF